MDTVFMVLGRWAGRTMFWRAGCFDSAQEARDEWEVYIKDTRDRADFIDVVAVTILKTGYTIADRLDSYVP